MLTLQKLDTIAVSIMIIIGLIFFGMSISVFKNLDSTCPSSTLRDGWALIQALGACMVVAGISYFICVAFGEGCYKKVELVRTSEGYIGIFAVFFLIIIGVCSAMLKEYSTISPADIQNCDDSSHTTKRTTIIVTVVSGVGLLLSIGSLFKTYLNQRKP